MQEVVEQSIMRNVAQILLLIGCLLFKMCSDTVSGLLSMWKLHILKQFIGTVKREPEYLLVKPLSVHRLRIYNQQLTVESDETILYQQLVSNR